MSRIKQVFYEKPYKLPPILCRTAKMAGGVHAPPIFTRGKWDLLYKPFLLDLMTVKRVAYYVDILRPTRATARTLSLARKCSPQ